MPYWSLPIIGFLVGLLIVSLGGGGGAIYVGVLTTLFNVPPAVAASTSLAAAIPTAGVGAFSHWRVGNVNVRVGAIMIGAGAAGTILGSLVGPPLLKRLGRDRLEPVLRVVIIVINGILGMVQLLK